MKISFQTGFGFDDVMIRPQKSDIEPKFVQLNSRITKQISICLPFVSSPMSTVTSAQMAIALAQAGTLGFIHRHCSIHDQVQIIMEVKQEQIIEESAIGPLLNDKGHYMCGAAIGAFDFERASALERIGVDVLLVDCVQPYKSKIIQEVTRLKKHVKIPIIVGNIVTSNAAKEFCEVGVDGLKVGLGPGSVCTTSKMTGIGIPQISALWEVSQVAKRYDIPVIADGGIKNSGDVIKALAAGAEVVMLGRLFAGTKEAPSHLIVSEGKKYKKYLASKYEILELSHPTGWKNVDKYILEELDKNFRVEGIGGLVPYAGPVHFVLLQLIKATQSGLAFVGAKNIKQFQERAEFIAVRSSHGASNNASIILQTEGNHIL